MVHRLGHLIMAIMWAAAGVFLLPLFSGKGGGGVAAASVSQPLKIAYTKTRTALTMTLTRMWFTQQYRRQQCR